jgi:hypothetical protein
MRLAAMHVAKVTHGGLKCMRAPQGGLLPPSLTSPNFQIGDQAMSQGWRWRDCGLERKREEIA